MWLDSKATDWLKELYNGKSENIDKILSTKNACRWYQNKSWAILAPVNSRSNKLENAREGLYIGVSVSRLLKKKRRFEFEKLNNGANLGPIKHMWIMANSYWIVSGDYIKTGVSLQILMKQMKGRWYHLGAPLSRKPEWKFILHLETFTPECAIIFFFSFQENNVNRWVLMIVRGVWIMLVRSERTWIKTREISWHTSDWKHLSGSHQSFLIEKSFFTIYQSSSTIHHMASVKAKQAERLYLEVKKKGSFQE